MRLETKECTICKKELPKTVEFFATRVDRVNIYFQSSCRSCQSEYRKIHYKNNKKNILIRQRNGWIV